MRKIVAALAAFLVLVFGLVTSTTAAQDRIRRAEGASVRASLVIRHVVQEGENLTTDDGLYGEGGIMQHYFGRHRSGDIARLRGYDGNRRAIRVARCDWPEDVPVEERTTLQDCPDAYARYTIRRSVGMVVEVPLRWVPTRRLAEILDVTPGAVRDMRRIALAVHTPESAPVDEDPGMAAEDPLGDAPTVTLAGTGISPDAGTDMVFTGTELSEPDAGLAIAAVPGIVPDSPHGGAGGTGGTEGGSPDDESSDGSDGNVVTANLLSPTGGGIGWSLVLLLGLVQGGAALRRRKAKRTEREDDERKNNPPLLDTDHDPEKLRRARDSYRAGVTALTAEKKAAEDKTIEVANKAADEVKAADDARKEVEHVLKQIGAQLGAPDVAAEPAETHPKRIREAVLEQAKQVATVIQKVALATGKKSTDHKGIVSELQKVVTGLMAVPATEPTPAAKRVEELEREKAELEETLRMARATLDNALTNVGIRDAEIVELKERIAELETANEDLARSIVTGGRDALDADEDLPGEGTQPGVGLAEVEGAPQGAPPKAKPRTTIGYQEMRARGDQTDQVTVPRSPKVPEVDDGPDADGENDPPAPGSGNGASHVSPKQPVMCGCGKEFRWNAWAAHVAICPDADKVRVPSPPEPPPATEVRSTKKERRRRRKTI